MTPESGGGLPMAAASSREGVADEAQILCFLCYRETAKRDGYRGGALVTDASGKPLEFRATSPVRPNPVQRTLYGKTLVPHIAQELFAVALIEALRTKPKVILVRDETLLNVRPRVQYPILHVRRQGEALQAPTHVERQSEAAEVVQSPSSQFQPVVITPHWQYSQEAAEVRALLQPVLAQMDLVEPFERVDRAIEELERQEGASDGAAVT